MKEVALQRYQTYQEQNKRDSALGTQEAIERNSVLETAYRQYVENYGFVEMENFSKQQAGQYLH